MTTIPTWARGHLIRAAFYAGAVAGQGATLEETRRAVRITLGETTARPLVRDARKNKRAGDGHRYADVGPFQISLQHFARLVPTELAALAARLLGPVDGTAEFLRRLRAGSVFYGERTVNDAATPDAKILAAVADAVLAEVERLVVAPLTGLPAGTQLTA